MAFLCRYCHQMHDERPAIGFSQPDAYAELSEAEKIAYHAECNGDFCIIRYPDQTDYFIRACLSLPIVGETDTFDYGVWVSLSEKSFADYQAHYHDDAEVFEEKVYFGRIVNHIAGYEWAQIPCQVLSQADTRPFVFPNPDFAHDLVRDALHGISPDEADRRIHRALGDLEDFQAA